MCRYECVCVCVCVCVNYLIRSDFRPVSWPDPLQMSVSHCRECKCNVPCHELGKQAPSKQSCVLVGLLLTCNPVSPADCREILLPMMTDQLKYHLERQEDLEACCQLLSNILEVLYRKDVVSNRGAASVDPEACVGLGSS